MNPLPLVNKVFSLFIQQERQLFTHIEDDKMVAQLNKPYMQGRSSDSRNKPYSFNKSKGLKTCTFFNKHGQIIEACLKKHGLPPYLKKTNLAQVNNDD